MFHFDLLFPAGRGPAGGATVGPSAGETHGLVMKRALPSVYDNRGHNTACQRTADTPLNWMGVEVPAGRSLATIGMTNFADSHSTTAGCRVASPGKVDTATAQGGILTHMNVALRKPRMTREAFFDWAEAQDQRYEFDGFEPVAMTGGTNNHDQIRQNVQFALRVRLRGSGCRPMGPDAGVATVGDAVRYPDALVTCTRPPGLGRLAPGVVVVFEVLSPSSGRRDRIEKLLEYRAVPSIRRYVILEHDSIGASVFHRDADATDWTATALTAGEILRMPEIGIEIPVDEFYEDVDLAAGE